MLLKDIKPKCLVTADTLDDFAYQTQYVDFDYEDLVSLVFSITDTMYWISLESVWGKMGFTWDTVDNNGHFQSSELPYTVIPVIPDGHRLKTLAGLFPTLKTNVKLLASDWSNVTNCDKIATCTGTLKVELDLRGAKLSRASSTAPAPIVTGGTTTLTLHGNFSNYGLVDLGCNAFDVVNSDVIIPKLLASYSTYRAMYLQFPDTVTDVDITDKVNSLVFVYNSSYKYPITTYLRSVDGEGNTSTSVFLNTLKTPDITWDSDVYSYHWLDANQNSTYKHSLHSSSYIKEHIIVSNGGIVVPKVFSINVGKYTITGSADATLDMDCCQTVGNAITTNLLSLWKGSPSLPHYFGKMLNIGATADIANKTFEQAQVAFGEASGTYKEWYLDVEGLTDLTLYSLVKTYMSNYTTLYFYKYGPDSTMASISFNFHSRYPVLQNAESLTSLVFDGDNDIVFASDAPNLKTLKVTSNGSSCSSRVVLQGDLNLTYLNLESGRYVLSANSHVINVDITGGGTAILLPENWCSMGSEEWYYRGTNGNPQEFVKLTYSSESDLQASTLCLNDWSSTGNYLCNSNSPTIVGSVSSVPYYHVWEFTSSTTGYIYNPLGSFYVMIEEGGADNFTNACVYAASSDSNGIIVLTQKSYARLSSTQVETILGRGFIFNILAN